MKQPIVKPLGSEYPAAFRSLHAAQSRENAVHQEELVVANPSRVCTKRVIALRATPPKSPSDNGLVPFLAYSYVLPLGVRSWTTWASWPLEPSPIASAILPAIDSEARRRGSLSRWA